MAESQASSSTRTTEKLSAAREAELAAEQERSLGRAVAIGLPAVTVLASIGVGLASSAGPAILVLAGGALLGAVVLLWASLRTLGGDAPLTESFETWGEGERHDDLHEKKERVLRALKDLENERAIGKLDEEDYVEVSARYRNEAKEILRKLDAEVAPQRARAEEIARTYLEKRGLGAAATAEEADETGVKAAEKIESKDDVTSNAKRDATKKIACPKCATENDGDATFCKKCATRLTPEAEEAPDASA